MKHKKLIIFLSLLFLIFISLVGYYFYGLSPVSNDEEKVIFEIAPLTSKKDIAQALKNEGNGLFTGRFYVKGSQVLLLTEVGESYSYLLVYSTELSSYVQ